MSIETAREAGDRDATSLEELTDEVRVRVLAKTASALADPVRLQIVELLREHGELTVGELTDRVPVTQPRVSVHLQCLTDCGFTAVRREGRRAHYRLAGPQVGDLLDLLTGQAAGAVDGLLACLACTPTGEPTESGGCC